MSDGLPPGAPKKEALAYVPGALDPRHARKIRERHRKMWLAIPADGLAELVESAKRQRSSAGIAESLGSNPDELLRLYGRAGRLTGRDEARRAEVDTALKVLVESGKLTQLEIGEALGWPIKRRPNGSECRKLAAALRRARPN
jgi:methylphosphotriester-DNA--protein-cysteine methyltransferase